ncbi:MAG: AAA family ATPase [bacterium]
MKKPKLREQLKKLMDERGISGNSVARSLGISSSTLSQYLSGSYKGAVRKVDEAVEDFIQRESERSTMNRGDLPFVMTTVTKRVLDIAKMTHLLGEVGVAYGDAGLGKTRSVKHYAAEHPDVILIEADLGYNARVLFQELCRKVGIDPNKNSLHGMLEECVKKLNGSGRIIIIDEAECQVAFNLSHKVAFKLSHRQQKITP